MVVININILMFSQKKTYYYIFFIYTHNGDFMKLYIDLIFMLNLFLDFILLISVSIILRRNVRIYKILMGSFIGSISIFLLFFNINRLELFIFKIITALLMVITTFKYKDLKYTIKNFLYLYMLGIILGGILYALNIEFSYKNTGIIFYHTGLSINWIIILILSPILIYIYTKQLLNLKNNYSNYYKVDIYLKSGKILKLNAFLDTGNNLIDPYKKRPIILINYNEIKRYMEYENILLVPFISLNNEDLLKCIKINKIVIKGIGERKNILLGISNKNIGIDGVDCILSTKLLEGKC